MRQRLLIYSLLFPSPWRPTAGIFVYELTRALIEWFDVDVVQPVIAHRNPDAFLRRCRRYELGGEIRVDAPVCFNFPGIFKATDAWLLWQFSRRACEAAVQRGAELIHAHFGYPDAVAAARIAGRHGRPLVVTVHGSDMNVLARTRSRRAQMSGALSAASAVVVVAEDLRKKVAELGVPSERIFHIPNGVDLARFSPGSKDDARRRLKIPAAAKVVLAVGGLVPVKAQDQLIRALAGLPENSRLILVGDGPERQRLQRLAQTLGVDDRVHMAGWVDHGALCPYYRAADLLAISSHSEGWPTVIYEAMASGLPIVATRVGGVGEAICTPALGMLVDDNDPAQLIGALRSGLARTWNPAPLFAAAATHTWRELAKRYVALYESVLCGSVRSASHPVRP